MYSPFSQNEGVGFGVGLGVGLKVLPHESK
jgi:hypothetical protein